MVPTLQLQLLGDFQIAYHGKQLRSVNTARLQSLLAYLLIHRQAPQSRQQLAYLFWPDTVEAKARANLRFFLHRLRRALPDAARFLEIGEANVTWRADASFSLDVAAFEDALAEAERETGAAARALQAAVTLYRGDLLPNCYDDWVLPERERLRQLYLAALARLVQVLETQGEYLAAISRAQQLLRQDPLHEESYRQLMRLHAGRGDRVGALRVYHACAAVLERELAVEPSPATRAEYEQLLRQAAPTPSTMASGAAPGYAALLVPEAPPNNLRLALTSFIGREREMAEITGRLATARLLTLTGVGGSGKTRLALEVAVHLLLAQRGQAADPRHADGVWWVELAPLGDPGLVAQAVAAALGAREARRQPLVESLIVYLRRKRLLLVWDNCEHLIGACAQLAEALLRACPGVSLLATSREPLRVEGEATWPVPPLSVPAPELVSSQDSFPQISQAVAVRLFSERAALAFPAFQLTASTAPAVAEICRRLDGLPLAIELAAARAKILTVDQIAQRLDDRFNLLKATPRQTSARHQSLRAVMDWSFELLAPAERALFQRLAAFAGGFTLEAVEAICVAADLESHQMLELLSLLVDKSLVKMDQDSGEVRFDLLETIREYALERLTASGEVDSVRRRHAQFYLVLGERAEPELATANQLQWVNRLDFEHGNVRAALAWSREHDVELGLRLSASIWRYWHMRSLNREGRAWLEALIPLSPAPTLARAKALQASNVFTVLQGDYETARAHVEEALQIYQQLGDRRRIAAALNELGLIDRYRGEHDSAQRLLEQSLAIKQELGLDSPRANTTMNLGLVAGDRGDCAAAYALHQESLAIFRASDEMFGMAAAYGNLGHMATRLGKLAEALAWQVESMRLFSELGDHDGLAECLERLAMLANAKSDFETAARFGGAASMLREKAGTTLAPSEQAEYDREVSAARARLDGPTFEAAWQAGQAMTFDALRELALSQAGRAMPLEAAIAEVPSPDVN
ncbi:MAG: tetratricopeptide repeat protein [Anaerolineales bacterium]|nr:tetratricopeptide repeat protein [Anaerolineales bacterium]